MAGLYAEAERPTHPLCAGDARLPDLRPGLRRSAKVRKAIAAYFGLVSFVDHNVGRLVKALEDNGLAGDTRIIYTSDHGDNLGTRGLWGKSNMYEESAAVPMIMAGPEVPHGVACREPVSLVDCFPDHRRLRRAGAAIPTTAICRARRCSTSSAARRPSAR